MPYSLFSVLRINLVVEVVDCGDPFISVAGLSNLLSMLPFHFGWLSVLRFSSSASEGGGSTGDSARDFGTFTFNSRPKLSAGGCSNVLYEDQQCAHRQVLTW
jgi:hypothetical protein